MRARARRVSYVALALIAVLATADCGVPESTTTSPDEPQQEEQVVEDPQGQQGETDTNEVADPGANDQRDPAEPPVATVSYEQNGSAQTTQPLSCSSTWSFEQDGETLTVNTEAPHPVEYSADGMPAVSVGEQTKVDVSFDVPATGVTVRRWSEMDILGSAAPLNGEAVESELADDGSASFNVQPGFRYSVNATFDAGEALYLFTVPSV